MRVRTLDTKLGFDRLVLQRLLRLVCVKVADNDEALAFPAAIMISEGLTALAVSLLVHRLVVVRIILDAATALLVVEGETVIVARPEPPQRVIATDGVFLLLREILWVGKVETRL
jgi:hypothetical protein